MSTDRFTQRILSHIADRRYQPRRPRELAEELGIAPEDFEEFRRSVKSLAEQGQVVLGDADAIALPPPGRQMTGTFRRNERGFGFIVPDTAVQHGDLFVPIGSTADAMTGDRVLARVVRRGDRGEDRSPFVGEIIEILQRAEKRYTGNLTKRGSHYVVEVDGRVFSLPVMVRDPHAKNAKVGDKVVIELIEYPADDRPAEGVITEVLGEQGEPEVETLAVMHAYGLADKFPNDVLEDARNAARSFQDNAIPLDREDLTRDFIVTIDPPDAKDFDDAISIRRLGAEGSRGQGAEGGEEVEVSGDRTAARSSPSAPRPHDPSTPSSAVWELGVHIADVSHFVKLGTALDGEAKKRGNSAYLPRRVIPMLPELLSNGVCSLQEGVNRFCKSAFIRYDAQGKPVGARFANTVIRSAKRMTYLEAQALIDGDLREARRHAKTEPKYPPVLLKTLALMNDLSKVIRERRMREGMIVLGLPKVELVYDDTGRVVDAQPEDDAYTHLLIEAFMVEANEAVARLFDSLQVPMIRRVHPDPDAHDITELRQFARVAGYNVPARPSRKELQTLLEGVRGKPAQHAIHLAVLKTLSRAEYSPALIGHFALASQHYTHFTSPIRRYPDLIVHRGLDAYFDAQRQLQNAGRSALGHAMSQDPRCPDESTQFQLGRHGSATERNAAAAEDELRTYLVLDLLNEKLGEDFEGTVTGVTAAGVFVEINRYLVDGFVKANDLPGDPSDRWRYNRLTGALVAQRSGRTVQIGDRFIVRIARVNPVSRQMDLVVIQGIRGDGSAKQHKQGKQNIPHPLANNAGTSDAPTNEQQPQQGGQPFHRKKKDKRKQPFGAKKSHKQSMGFKKQKKRDRRRRW